jgi:hypothetical protein
MGTRFNEFGKLFSDEALVGNKTVALAASDLFKD